MQIPLYRTSLLPEDQRVAAEFLQSGHIFGGREATLLEAELAERMGVKECVAVSSGTTALYVLFQAMGAAPGDRLLIPDYTWPSAANCSELLGTTTELLDVSPASFSLEPETLREALSRPHEGGTTWVVAIHQFGLVHKLPQIAALAREFGARLIEDAAWSLGAVTPLHGEAGILSFHPRKVISAGEGGAIYTDDAALAARCRRYRNHGLEGGRFVVPALNARMTELQARLVRNQLQRLDAIVAERHAIADHYLGALSQIPGLFVQRGDGEMLWQAFAMTFQGTGFAQVKAGMAQHGVAIARAGVATHLEPWYAQKYGYKLPGSASLGKEAFTLPSFEGMRAQELDHVVHALISTITQLAHA